MEKKDYKNIQKTRPVVFIHSGNSFYLKYTTGQALKVCSRVVLLGDKSNVGYVPEHYYMKDFENKKLEEFKKVYINMSWNRYSFEVGCYIRFFLLAEFMERFQLEDAVMVDSDLMSYEDLSKYDFKAEIAASLPPDLSGYRWSCSPHVFYTTKKAVDCFIDYMISLYRSHVNVLQEKWLYHTALGNGGVADMTLLYLFIRQTSLKIKNLYEVCIDSAGANVIFDHNYNLPQVGCRVSNRGGVKMVKFKNGIPYFMNEEGSIKAYTVHLQGKAKFYIDCIARENTSYILMLLNYTGRRTVSILKKMAGLLIHGDK